jgi:nitroreductase
MGLGLYNFKVKVQNEWLLPIVRKYPKLADLYYFLFSSDFSREHQRVLQGKYLHMKAFKEGNPNAFHLRRQIHRLEKGLSMKNRRNVFALDYLMNAVENYKILSEKPDTTGDVDESVLRWSYNVLQHYFNVTDPENTVIKMAHEVFRGVRHRVAEDREPYTCIPYKRSEGIRSNIGYDEFLKLTQQRRSVRCFLDKPVPRELIESACVAAAYSPSACNRQPFEVRVFDDKKLILKVGALPQGIKANYKSFPMLAVVVIRLSAYMSERDRHVVYIDGGLFSMSFMLALETLGLSSVPINWPDIEFYEKQMDDLLGLAPDERAMMLMGIGFADPDGGIPYSQKKTPAQLLKFNKVTEI